MNPFETMTTTTEHSLHKTILIPNSSGGGVGVGSVCGQSGSVSSYIPISTVSSNNLIEIKDQQIITTTPLYADKAFIKHVIGAGQLNNHNHNHNHNQHQQQHQHSILKKTPSPTSNTFASIQVPVVTNATLKTSSPSPSSNNNIVKTFVRPAKTDTSYVKTSTIFPTATQHQQQQQSTSLAWSSECKFQNPQQQQQQQILITTSTSSIGGAAIAIPNPSAGQQSLIKLVAPVTVPALSDKHSVLKRQLPMLQPKVFPMPQTSSLAMQSPASHIVYRTINGNSAANCTEIYSTSLLTQPTAAQLTNRKQSVRDTKILTGAQQIPQRRSSIRDIKLVSTNPTTIIRTRTNSFDVSNPLEVTQLSSTVTLTKSTTVNSKQQKQPKSQKHLRPILPSPLVTLEKKNNNFCLINYSKNKNKSVFGNEINEKPANTNTNESGQKNLTTKQTTSNHCKSPPRQQSLLKVNSLARLLHTSPRTKRSKSMTLVGNAIKKSGRSRKSRRLSTASDGELLQKAVEQLTIKPSESANEEAKMKTNSSSTVDTVSPIITSSSLLCNDKVEKIPSSSSNNSSLELSPQKDPKMVIKPGDKTYFNSGQMNMVLGMLSTFNMLTWKERVGHCKQSEMKFQLNELNLVQIAENCKARNNDLATYEKPIFERTTPDEKNSNFEKHLYCCRRCECHGAPEDFLAPDFCSYDCFRRESRKHSKMNILTREHEVRDRFKKAKTCPIVCDISAENQSLTTKRFFTWDSHLSTNEAEQAPIDLFLNPFPCGANQFEVGMKLEAIDPEHNSLFCVCTVVEIKGYRLKLNFDGYSKIHNFWVNADSMDIFPPGWCAKTNRVLQPPKGMNMLSFNWPAYLSITKSLPALRSLFTHLNSSSKRNPFKVGMRLEAIDLKNTGKICVATVADVLDNRILIHFDGWDESYDYWIDINSPYIHPINWHKQNGLELIPPPDWEEYFDWPEYLEFMRCEAAKSSMFLRRDPMEFSAGMKLEVVDFKNPSLIRPATVLHRNEYKLLVHLDGWPRDLIYWVNDDSPDIHPITWSGVTGHGLEPPPGYQQLDTVMPCPVRGCRGIGHATRADVYFHANRDTCPYEEKNWVIEIEKPSRLDEMGRFTYDEKVLTKQEDKLSKQEERMLIREEEKLLLKQDEKILPKVEQTETAPPPSNNTDITNIETFKKLSTAQVESALTTDQKIISPTINNTIFKVPKKEKDSFSLEKEINIARKYLCDYGPRLKQNYTIWQENGNFNSSAIKKNPLEWTTDETAHYISTKCHPIGHLFKREDIDGAALLSMHQSDLTDILNLKLGPSVKIFSHILHLRQQVVSRFMNTNK